jgi:putative ABC transport system ATP-binding protein
MADRIVTFKGVSKHYRTGGVTTQVLHDIELGVEEGELVAVVGTSGSGKSTLLNIIGGLDRGYLGQVIVTGSDLGTLSDPELSHLRNSRVGFVFQQFNLLDHLSCAENVSLPAMFAARSIPDAAERARRALRRVGLGDRAHDFPGNLSGGQKQRIAIARALFNEPRLLLCDEPTGNLDSRTGQQIIDLFTQLNREDGITLVVVTHESRVARIAHRVLRLEDGHLLDGAGSVGVADTLAAEV